MAEKKKNSRALKAVNDTKKKTGNPTSSVKKKDTGKGIAPVMEEPPIPLRTIGAAVSFVLFVVFLLMVCQTGRRHHEGAAFSAHRSGGQSGFLFFHSRSVLPVRDSDFQ